MVNWLSDEALEGFRKAYSSATRPKIRVYKDRTKALPNWKIDCPGRDKEGELTCGSPQEGINWEFGWSDQETAMRLADRHMQQHTHDIMTEAITLGSLRIGDRVFDQDGWHFDEEGWGEEVATKETHPPAQVTITNRPEDMRWLPDPEQPPRQVGVGEMLTQLVNQVYFVTPDGNQWRMGTMIQQADPSRMVRVELMGRP